MKKLKIGYVPLSQNLKAPGDRRRLLFWVKKKGHEIVLDLSERIDLIVVPQLSDLHHFSKINRTVPIIFDLADGYIVRENLVKDWTRGTLKCLSNQIKSYPRSYTYFVKELCRNSDAVICSSIEQAELIKEFSNNIHIILDSHEEVPMHSYAARSEKTNQMLFWEGLPYTIHGFKSISKVMNEDSKFRDLDLLLVTDPYYNRILGNYFPIKTERLLRKNLAINYKQIKLVPWSVDNLVRFSKIATAGVIPLNISNPIQKLKPENRLLLMWRLGLPVITSAIPSYIRIQNELKLNFTCTSDMDWSTNLTKILENNEFAEHMVRQGQKYITLHHTEDLLLSRWDNAIRSVL